MEQIRFNIVLCLENNDFWTLCKFIYCMKESNQCYCFVILYRQKPNSEIPPKEERKSIIEQIRLSKEKIEEKVCTINLLFI